MKKPNNYTVFAVSPDLEYCRCEKEVAEALKDSVLICDLDYRASRRGKRASSFEDDLKVGDELYDMGHIISDMSHLYGHLNLSDDAVRGQHQIWTCYEQWAAMKGDLCEEDMAHFNC